MTSGEESRRFRGMGDWRGLTDAGPRLTRCRPLDSPPDRARNLVAPRLRAGTRYHDLGIPELGMRPSERARGSHQRRSRAGGATPAHHGCGARHRPAASSRRRWLLTAPLSRKTDSSDRAPAAAMADARFWPSAAPRSQDCRRSLRRISWRGTGPPRPVPLPGSASERTRIERATSWLQPGALPQRDYGRGTGNYDGARPNGSTWLCPTRLANACYNNTLPLACFAIAAVAASALTAPATRRAHLFQTCHRHGGFEVWNYWYAGRYEFVSYSVLYYALAAGRPAERCRPPACSAGFAAVCRREGRRRPRLFCVRRDCAVL
jgi:hypothetical protein